MVLLDRVKDRKNIDCIVYKERDRVVNKMMLPQQFTIVGKLTMMSEVTTATTSMVDNNNNNNNNAQQRWQNANHMQGMLIGPP